MPRITVLLVAAALVARPAPAQHRVTTPRQALGFDVGADYHLATYTQLEAYWRTLARESPRMVLREIGKTAEGRPQLMAIITAPANHKRLARYEDIARRLALAQELTDEQAHALAREGKAAVWIDGELLRERDRKSTRLNSSHGSSSYRVFCLEKHTRQGK